MERKVNEVFDYKEVSLKVVEDITCIPCYFFPYRCQDRDRFVTGYCTAKKRHDGASVVFIQELCAS